MPRAVEEVLNMIPEPWRTMVFALLGFATLLVVLIKSLDKVETGYLGMRARFGKIVLRYDRRLPAEEIKRQKAIDTPLVRSGRAAQYGRPTVYQPGITYQVILVHRYIKIQTISKPYALDDITITSEDGYDAVILRQSVLYAYVSDIYLRHMASADPEMAIRSAANTALTIILRQVGLESLQHMSASCLSHIELRLKQALIERLVELGFEFDRFEIGTVNPIADLATGRAIHEIAQGSGISVGNGKDGNVIPIRSRRAS